MNAVSSLTTLELALIILSFELTAGLVYAFYFQFKRKAALEGASRAAAGDLLDKVADKAESRRAALTVILQDAYNLEGEELEKFADEFLAREDEFYRAIAEVFANRDYERLQNLTEDLNKVVAPCIGMVPANQVDKSEADALQSMVEALESTNAKLNQDLAETTTNLEQITAEFNAAFAKAAGEAMTEAEGEAAPADAGEPAGESAAAEAATDDASPAAAEPGPEETVTSNEPQASENVPQAAKPAGEMHIDESGVFDLSADDIDNLIENMGEEAASA